MNLYRDHSASTSLGNGEGEDEESNKKWHRKEGVRWKKWCFSHKFLYVLSSVTQFLFLLGFWSSPHIQECAYQYIWNNYKTFAQKYYNSTTLSIWVVYAKYVSKNSIASKDVIFYLLWYNLLSWSFFSLILQFLIEVWWITQGKLTKCDK